MLDKFHYGYQMRNVPAMNDIFQDTRNGIHMKFYVFQNEIIPDLCRGAINTNGYLWNTEL